MQLRALSACLLLSASVWADSSMPGVRPPGAEVVDPAVERFRVPASASAPARGPADARVTIVEYAEFQCPFCARAQPTLARILARWPNDVRIVWKNQPLPFHQHARPAARLAMAAHAQGKFWTLHDTLFENQRALDADALARYGQAIGVETPPAGGKVDAAIEADVAEAARVGANGTPTFFVNGRVLAGAQPFEKFEAVILEELAAADRAIQRGVPRARVYEAMIANGKEKVVPRPVTAAPAMAEDRTVRQIALGDAPVRGGKGAPVTIVEWSDFQCPYCARVSATLRTVLDTYGDKVRLVFKQMPLSFHKDAHLAAQAALEARAQGKFWEMHDKLFDNPRALARADLERYAAELKLDLGRFRAALDRGTWKQRVDQDIAQATALGVNATPTFFVNGRILSGAQPFESFQARIDAELK
jgi:protein-disulfide isomerase